MKLAKYIAGQIARSLQGKPFIATREMLLGPLMCVCVGHEMCAHCGQHIEIWKTPNKRYMPLAREGEITVSLHYHAQDQRVDI